MHASASAPTSSTLVFLSAAWRDLVVINYEMPRDILNPFIPHGTELDLWNGRALASIVAFRFLNTRVLGLKIPFHSDFTEINLRFYVKRSVGSAERRGVVFIKEIVPRYAIAATARCLYNENYHALPITHAAKTEGTQRTLSYGWRDKGRTSTISASVTGEPALLQIGSEAEFILEHYWGYSRSRSGATTEYEVAHPRWRIWSDCRVTTAIDFEGTYGSAFAPFLSKTPCSLFVADGSDISVHRGRILHS